MNDKTKRAVWMLVRIVSALAIGHVAFFFLMLTLRLGTGLVVSEIGCLCLCTLVFCMLRVRHWRFWVAVAIGVALWFATMVVHVYTDPLYDAACGHTRYFGLPLPAHRANDCSTGYSAIADGKPGRLAINLLFWCYIAYALVIAPSIVRWFREAWRSHKKYIIVSAAVLSAVVALVVVYRQEIAVNWYAPRKWQSPRGYRRLPRELWPERTWWENVKSYF